MQRRFVDSYSDPARALSACKYTITTRRSIPSMASLLSLPQTVAGATLGDNGVVKYPGLVDSLVDLLGSSEDNALQRSRKSRKSAISHAGKTTATLFRDILFGAVVRERAYCSACRKATDVLKDRCYITLKVGVHASATPVRLEDLLEAWGNVGGSGPKCARGCKNSRCSVAQMLEREPPVLAIVLNRLEKGKKRIVLSKEQTHARLPRRPMTRRAVVVSGSSAAWA